MSDEPQERPGRRLTAAARAHMNELIRGGLSVSEAMQRVSSDESAFEAIPATPAAPPPASPPLRPAWSGDSTDWSGVIDRLDRLRSVDSIHLVFGARTHGYRLNPPLSEREVRSFERRWKFSMPPGLRALYTQVGNGGAGPGYGLFPLAELKRFKASKPYPGVEALRARAPRDSLPRDPLLAPLRPSQRTGLLATAHLGCGVYIAVVSAGDVGRVVTLDDQGITETDETLVEHVTKWLDGEIGRFEPLCALRARGAPREEMVEAMIRVFPQLAFRSAADVDAALSGLDPESWQPTA